MYIHSGVKKGAARVEPYNPAWAELFEQEKSLLERAFGNRILAIEHVGSTAIPDLPAKPIIDINIGVSSLSEVADFIDKLPSLGYTYLLERSYPTPEFSERHLFVKGHESGRTHHLKLLDMHNEASWREPLLFRDYLRSHPVERKAYSDLKLVLAEKYADDREKYTLNKGEFIQEIIRKAKYNNA